MAKTLTKEEIKYLMQSGFTIAEIKEMQEDTPEQEQTPEQDVNPVENPEQEQDNSAEQEQTPEQEQPENIVDANAELLKSLKTEIESLKKAIQSSNRRTNIIETNDNQQTMTDILNTIAEEYK